MKVTHACLLGLLACGGAASPSRTPAAPSSDGGAVAPPPAERGAVVAGTPAVDRAAPPADVLAFARRLMAAADAEQHDMIDWTRQAAIAGAVGVDDTTTSLPPPRAPQPGRGLPVEAPSGCVPAYTWSGGYELIAIPPPMEGWPEPVAARVQQAIDYLTAGHELMAWCTYMLDAEAGEDADGNPRTELRPTPGPAFVLNVYEGPQGWRVQAWSELRGREGSSSPQE